MNNSEAFQVMIWIEIGFLDRLNSSEILAAVNEGHPQNAFRLPSESEWEYAALGGPNWTDEFVCSGSNDPERVAWYDPRCTSGRDLAAQLLGRRFGWHIFGRVRFGKQATRTHEVAMKSHVRQRFAEFLACFLFSLAPVMPASGQAQDRVVEWPPYPVGRINSAGAGIVLSPVTAALEIVEVRVADRPIAIGQSFIADDDWVRSLTFRMKNISGQPIIGARLGLGLPETKTADNSLGFSLEYGKGLSTGIPSDEQKVIGPDEEFELKFSESQYQRHKKFVSERSKRSSFSKVWVGITTVKFADGSIWSSGCLRGSDPSNSCTPRAP
jgi:hypothetical protein